MGASFIRLFRASVVLPLERASSILPTVISVRIMAADSNRIHAYIPSRRLYFLPAALRSWRRARRTLQTKTPWIPWQPVCPYWERGCQRALNPLMKNFWLMTITMAASRSCTSPTAIWLPSNQAGSGQFHIICPWRNTSV